MKLNPEPVARCSARVSNRGIVATEDLQIATPVKTVAAFLLASAVVCCAETRAAEGAVVTAPSPRPNIVLVYTDDHAGWAVGAYGNKEIHTPHMDRLAAEGMRFNQAFTKPVCSPSRAMVLTGQYSHRLGIPDYIPYGNPVHAANGLPAGTATIASVLKSIGYATGLVGKWHLGYGDRYYPERFGFDHAEGYRYIAPGKQLENVGQIPFLVDGREIERFRLDPRHTDVLADRAIHFIRANREKPFFLFFSTYVPHLPWGAVPEEDRTHYTGRPLAVPDLSQFPEATLPEEKLRELTRQYYANITCADRNLGRLLSVLDELELARNTIVMFIGDNGFNVGQHGLLGKGNARILGADRNRRRPNMFDHSVLVPFIVRWPATVKPGATSDALVSTIDVLPTVIDVTTPGAGRKLQLDGASLLPLLTEKTGGEWRDAYCDTYDMIYLAEAHMRMIRTDRWKLVLYLDEKGNPLKGKRHELFDLQDDPQELVNLHDRPLAKTAQKRLEGRLADWMRDAGVRQTVVPPTRDPLPVVILLGDSIRVNYEKVVRNELAGKATVWAPRENCAHSAFTAERIEQWVKDRSAAVIHVNCGLHDLFLNATTDKPRHSLDVYERNLRTIFKRLREFTDAKIIFALTTAVNERRQATSKSYGRVVRRNTDIAVYNTKAREIAQEFDIRVNDLDAVMKDAGVEKMLAQDGVHLSPEGAKRVGKQVAQAILAAQTHSH